MADTCYFPDTYALVLCGGKSDRMGTDKSMLQYYDKPQRYHVYDMLQALCEKVFISCSSEQSKHAEGGYHYITDDAAFSNIGPMAALLTAFSTFPGKHILMIGCDYPLLNRTELETFSKHCKSIPASFYNQQAAVYESMLAWYPYTCAGELIQLFNRQQYSLQHLLKNNHAVQYLPANTRCIQSVDTMESFTRVFNQLNKQ